MDQFLKHVNDDTGPTGKGQAPDRPLHEHQVANRPMSPYQLDKGPGSPNVDFTFHRHDFRGYESFPMPFGDAARDHHNEHSFPFQLKSLSRKWYRIIPEDAILNFEYVDDVISRQYDVLDSAIRQYSNADYDHARLQELYNQARSEIGKVISDAASTTSLSLIHNNATQAANREAFKEYADLHLKALGFLIERANDFLLRFNKQLPNIVKSVNHRIVWPVEHMSRIHDFVELTKAPEWQRAPSAGNKHVIIPSLTVLLDYEKLQHMAAITLMSIGFIVLANAVQLSVHFGKRSIGFDQFGLTALLLTSRWPVRLLFAMSLRRQSSKTQFELTTTRSGVLALRVLILSGLQAAGAMIMAFSMHNISLISYQILYTSVVLLISGFIRRQFNRLQIAIMVLAAVSPIFIIINTSVQPSNIVLTLVAIASVLLVEIHEIAHNRLLLPVAMKDASSLSSSSSPSPSDAISECLAFAMIMIILLATSEWRGLSYAASTISPSVWPSFLALCMFIAVQPIACDFIVGQLDRSSRVPKLSALLTMTSFVLVMIIAIELMNEDYSIISLAAALITMIAMIMDYIHQLGKTHPEPDQGHDNTTNTIDVSTF